jgi:hypothetical protein
MSGWIDCHELQTLPHCGRLRQVLNLSDRPVELQGFVPDANEWYTVLPFVGPHSQHDLAFGGIWLPRTMILRTAKPGTQEEIEVHGVVGEGLSVVQRG